MRHALRYCAFLTFFFLVGCSLWPSNWRIGGSPLDKNERAQAKLDQAKEHTVARAQVAVHQAEIALQQAPADNRPVTVGRDYVAEARALLDQANGAPTLAEETAWRELVAGLLSDNAATRASAEKQRASDSAAAADLAHRLAAATAAAERANDRALSYARESEGLADFARKLKLGIFAIVGLLILGSVLSVAARFVPALGLASRVINGVVAPGITFVAHRAEAGLLRVGEALNNARTVLPDKAEQLTHLFDGVTDADHQQLIAAGAAAAQTPPAK
jgi:hypothetical protein